MSLFEQLPLFRSAAPPSSTPVGRMRHLLVGGHLVAYQLRQAAGRRLAITIDESGVRVGAPPRLTLGEIETFVRGHGEWVVRKLDEFASRPVRRHLSIRNGMRLPVLGEDVEVWVVPGGNRVLWQGDALVIAARADADLEALAARPLCRADGPGRAAAAPVVGAHALGQLFDQERHPPQLAAGAPAASVRRLRGGA